MSDDILLSVRDLTKQFPTRNGLVKAVDGVSFDVRRGRIVGLVGESGSGKTTVGRCVLRLVEPSSGQVRFDGADVLALSDRDLRTWRRRAQIIFQDPYSSLNPRLRVEDIVGEALDTHGLSQGPARRARIGELLARVGLDPEHGRRFPHEFSGGQRQRLAIARALITRPELIVLDEPVSALDVSIRAQVLDLLADLQARLGLTYLFITHDLMVVRAITDRVMVMSAGRVVEEGATARVLDSPDHPVTKALVDASLHLDRVLG